MSCLPTSQSSTSGENPWCLGPTWSNFQGPRAAPGHLHHGWRWAEPLSPRGCGCTEARGAFKLWIAPELIIISHSWDIKGKSWDSHSPFFLVTCYIPPILAQPRHSISTRSGVTFRAAGERSVVDDRLQGSDPEIRTSLSPWHALAHNLSCDTTWPLIWPTIMYALKRNWTLK